MQRISEKRARLLIAAAAIVVVTFAALPVFAESFTISANLEVSSAAGNCTTNLATGNFWDDVAIAAGVTVTVDCPGNGWELGSLAVSGTLTSKTIAQSASGLIISATGDVTINAGGAINVNGKGYAGGYSGTAALGPGAGGSPDNGGGKVGQNGNYTGGGGGGNGGAGGRAYQWSSMPTYGLGGYEQATDVFAPEKAGGGGGGLMDSATPGGAGGGKMKIVALGTFTNNGTISANGANGAQAHSYAGSGGGAGGSIWIDAATVAGAGAVTAIGGNGLDGTATGTYDFSGGGGGGRIAIHYDTSMPSALFAASSVAGGISTGNNTTAQRGVNGSVGSLVFKRGDNAELMISGVFPITTATFAYPTLVLSNATLKTGITTAVTLTDVTITGAPRFACAATTYGLTISSPNSGPIALADLAISGCHDVVITAPNTADLDLTNARLSGNRNTSISAASGSLHFNNAQISSSRDVSISAPNGAVTLTGARITTSRDVVIEQDFSLDPVTIRNFVTSSIRNLTLDMAAELILASGTSLGTYSHSYWQEATGDPYVLFAPKVALTGTTQLTLTGDDPPNQTTNPSFIRSNFEFWDKQSLTIDEGSAISATGNGMPGGDSVSNTRVSGNTAYDGYGPTAGTAPGSGGGKYGNMNTGSNYYDGAGGGAGAGAGGKAQNASSNSRGWGGTAIAVNPLAPDKPGGGGGGLQSNGTVGAAGGGTVKIKVGTLTMDGNIYANGANGAGAYYYYYTLYVGTGGGGGGSVWVEADVISGKGVLEAKGGLGGYGHRCGNGPGGGGGGGSIFLRYGDMSGFKDASDVPGIRRSNVAGGGVQIGDSTSGTAATPGSVGGIVAQNAAGTEIYTTGLYEISGSPVNIDSITFAGGQVRIKNSATINLGEVIAASGYPTFSCAANTYDVTLNLMRAVNNSLANLRLSGCRNVTINVVESNASLTMSGAVIANNTGNVDINIPSGSGGLDLSSTQINTTTGDVTIDVPSAALDLTGARIATARDVVITARKASPATLSNFATSSVRNLTLDLSDTITLDAGTSLGTRPYGYWQDVAGGPFILYAPKVTLTNTSALTLTGNSFIRSNFEFWDKQSLTIETGSAISATGNGMPGGDSVSSTRVSGNIAYDGYGPTAGTAPGSGGGKYGNMNTGSNYYDGGGGGAGAGAGGKAQNATSNGRGWGGTAIAVNPLAPDKPGGGGGGLQSNGTVGAAGGGVVKVKVANLALNGTINANGADGAGVYYYYYTLYVGTGGGGGGSVWVEADTITGAGALQAKGGLGGYGHRCGNGPGGGGGGGTVFLRAGDMSGYTGLASANVAGGGVQIGDSTSGTAATAGSSGGVVTSNGDGSDIYTTGNYEVTSATTTLGTLTLAGGQVKIKTSPAVINLEEIIVTTGNPTFSCTSTAYDVTLNMLGTGVNDLTNLRFSGCRNVTIQVADAGGALTNLTGSLNLTGAIISGNAGNIAVNVPSGEATLTNAQFTTSVDVSITARKAGTTPESPREIVGLATSSVRNVTLDLGEHLLFRKASLRTYGAYDDGVTKPRVAFTNTQALTLTGDAGAPTTNPSAIVSNFEFLDRQSLTIDEGSSISAYGTGSPGGNSVSNTRVSGNAAYDGYGPTAGTSPGSGGGKYGTCGGYGYRGGGGGAGAGATGGNGGNPSLPTSYGTGGTAIAVNPLAPDKFGGGGGGYTGNCTANGAAGGGTIKVRVRSLAMNGTISANGGGGWYTTYQYAHWKQGNGGGGGGSVWVEADTIAGAGAFQAKGGDGGTSDGGLASGGGGGGGSIFLRYGDMSAYTGLGNASVAGGVSPVTGTGVVGTAGGTGGITVVNTEGTVVYTTGNYDVSSTPVTLEQLTLAGGMIRFLTSANLTINHLAVLGGAPRFSCTANTSDMTVTINESGPLDLTGLQITGCKNVSFSLPNQQEQTISGASISAVNNVALNFGHAVAISGGTITGGGTSTAGVKSLVTFPNTAHLTLTGNATLSGNVEATALEDFALDAGSTINAGGKGYPGVVNASGIGGNAGSAPANGGGLYVNGSAGAGGGYGGDGGANGGSTTGGGAAWQIDSLRPDKPGSSGSAGGTGGAGGGVVKISATGTFALDGTIYAHGGAGVSGGGGGSGGSIWLEAGTLTGAGKLYAYGGAGDRICGYRCESYIGSGGGSGGRIAVWYSDRTGFPGINATNINAAGGSGGNNNSHNNSGKTGTRVFVQRDGPDDDARMDRVEVIGPLPVTPAVVAAGFNANTLALIDGSILAAQDTTIALDAITQTGTSGIGCFGSRYAITLDFPDDASASTWSGLRFSAPAGHNGTDCSEVVIDEPALSLALEDTQLRTGALFTLKGLSLDTTSFINATGRGSAGGAGTYTSKMPGQGPGGGGGGYANHRGGGGGGHGGAGGHGGGIINYEGAGGAANDVLQLPEFKGSGGGGGGDVGNPGGAGGGRIIIATSEAFVMTGNASLIADGETPAYGAGSPYNTAAGGGGAGGTVKIQTAAIDTSATSVITAKGGNGAFTSSYSLNGGGGGGGRIAIVSDSGPFLSSLAVTAGTATAGNTYPATAGAIGTVFMAINTPPAIGAIDDVSTAEDTPTPARAFTIADAETPPQNLTLTATSSNTALVPNGNIAFGGSGADRTVTVTPAANRSGSSVITVTVGDGASADTETFTVTVTPVNDAPTITTISYVPSALVNEAVAVTATVMTNDVDAGDVVTADWAACQLAAEANGKVAMTLNGNSATFVASGLSEQLAFPCQVTVNDAGDPQGEHTAPAVKSATAGLLITWRSNTVPIIAGAGPNGAIPDVTIDEDTSTAAIAFTAMDPDEGASAPTVTATSTNQLLVPNGNIVLGGSGESRTVRVTPVANRNGSAVITLEASDGLSSVIRQFQVTVARVNDPIAFTSITYNPVVDPAQTYLEGTNVAVTMNTADIDRNDAAGDTPAYNWSACASANVAVTPAGASAIFRASGLQATLPHSCLVTATDGGGVSVQGTVSLSFTVNAKPTISNIADVTTNEDTPTGAIAYAVGDAETAAGSLVVTAVVSDMTPGLLSGGGVVLGGSGANRTVAITPMPNKSGRATITLNVSDGFSTTSDSFVLTVDPVDDVPTIGAAATYAPASTLGFDAYYEGRSVTATVTTADADTGNEVPDVITVNWSDCLTKAGNTGGKVSVTPAGNSASIIATGLVRDDSPLIFSCSITAADIDGTPTATSASLTLRFVDLDNVEDGAPLTVDGEAIIDPPPGTEVSLITIEPTGALTLKGGLAVTGDLIVNGKLIFDFEDAADLLLIHGNIIVGETGEITHAAGNIYGVTMAGDHDVALAGKIDVSGKGCANAAKVASNIGPTPVQLNPASGTPYHAACGVVKTGAGASGGGHGGVGENGANGIGNGVYGTIFAPTYLGTAGAALKNSDGAGLTPGAGGGRIWIRIAGTFDAAGRVLADGGQGSATGAFDRAGGGSGGSIFIESATFAANPNFTISASGGASTGGGGGGGRIALWYDDFMNEEDRVLLVTDDANPADRAALAKIVADRIYAAPGNHQRNNASGTVVLRDKTADAGKRDLIAGTNGPAADYDNLPGDEYLQSGVLNDARGGETILPTAAQGGASSYGFYGSFIANGAKFNWGSAVSFTGSWLVVGGGSTIIIAAEDLTHVSSQELADALASENVNTIVFEGGGNKVADLTTLPTNVKNVVVSAAASLEFTNPAPELDIAADRSVKVLGALTTTDGTNEFANVTVAGTLTAGAPMEVVSKSGITVTGVVNSSNTGADVRLVAENVTIADAGKIDAMSDVSVVAMRMTAPDASIDGATVTLRQGQTDTDDLTPEEQANALYNQPALTAMVKDPARLIVAPAIMAEAGVDQLVIAANYTLGDDIGFLLDGTGSSEDAIRATRTWACVPEKSERENCVGVTADPGNIPNNIMMKYHATLGTTADDSDWDGDGKRTLTFRLTIEDTRLGLKESDEVTVVVMQAPPTISEFRVHGATVISVGEGSILPFTVYEDPDGPEYVYRWTMNGTLYGQNCAELIGPSCSTTTTDPNLTLLAPNVYTTADYTYYVQACLLKEDGVTIFACGPQASVRVTSVNGQANDRPTAQMVQMVDVDTGAVLTNFSSVHASSIEERHYIRIDGTAMDVNNDPIIAYEWELKEARVGRTCQSSSPAAAELPCMVAGENFWYGFTPSLLGLGDFKAGGESLQIYAVSMSQNYELKFQLKAQDAQGAWSGNLAEAQLSVLCNVDAALPINDGTAFTPVVDTQQVDTTVTQVTIIQSGDADDTSTRYYIPGSTGAGGTPSSGTGGGIGGSGLGGGSGSSGGGSSSDGTWVYEAPECVHNCGWVIITVQNQQLPQAEIKVENRAANSIIRMTICVVSEVTGVNSCTPRLVEIQNVDDPPEIVIGPTDDPDDPNDPGDPGDPDDPADPPDQAPGILITANAAVDELTQVVVRATAEEPDIEQSITPDGVAWVQVADADSPLVDAAALASAIETQVDDRHVATQAIFTAPEVPDNIPAPAGGFPAPCEGTPCQPVTLKLVANSANGLSNEKAFTFFVKNVPPPVIPGGDDDDDGGLNDGIDDGPEPPIIRFSCGANGIGDGDEATPDQLARDYGAIECGTAAGAGDETTITVAIASEEGGDYQVSFGQGTMWPDDDSSVTSSTAQVTAEPGEWTTVAGTFTASDRTIESNMSEDYLVSACANAVGGTLARCAQARVTVVAGTLSYRLIASIDAGECLKLNGARDHTPAQGGMAIGWERDASRGFYQYDLVIGEGALPEAASVGTERVFYEWEEPHQAFPPQRVHVLSDGHWALSPRTRGDARLFVLSGADRQGTILGRDAVHLELADAGLAGEEERYRSLPIELGDVRGTRSTDIVAAAHAALFGIAGGQLADPADALLGSFGSRLVRDAPADAVDGVTIERLQLMTPPAVPPGTEGFGSGEDPDELVRITPVGGEPTNTSYFWNPRLNICFDADGRRLDCAEFEERVGAAAAIDVVDPAENAALSVRQGIAILDVNADGIEDICYTTAAPGIACVFSTAGAFAESDAPDWSIAGNPARDALGFVLSAGDVDGDGRKELVAGSPSRGMIFVFSVARGAGSIAQLIDAKAMIAGESGAAFGYALDASHDINADGIADIAIGAPLENDGGLADCGAFYLFIGHSAMGGTYGRATMTRVPYEEAGAMWGSDLFVRRLNGDLLAEVVVSTADGISTILDFSRAAPLRGGILLEPGERNGAAGTVDTGQVLGVPMLQLKITNGTAGAVRLRSLDVQSAGLGSDNRVIAAVKLYRDVDGDGRLGENDVQAGDAQRYVEDDGELTFAVDETFVGFEVKRYIVTYDFQETEVQTIEQPVAYE